MNNQGDIYCVQCSWRVGASIRTAFEEPLTPGQQWIVQNTIHPCGGECGKLTAPGRVLCMTCSAQSKLHWNEAVKAERVGRAKATKKEMAI